MDGEIITTKKISKISYSFFEEIFINQIVKKKILIQINFM